MGSIFLQYNLSTEELTQKAAVFFPLPLFFPAKYWATGSVSSSSSASNCLMHTHVLYIAMFTHTLAQSHRTGATKMAEAGEHLHRWLMITAANAFGCWQ